VAIGVAVAVASIDCARAEGVNELSRLIDHDAHVAVFSRAGELHAVHDGERLPGGAIRVRRVGESGVQLEYPASAQSTGGIFLLKRGDQVPDVWPAPAKPAEAIPLVTATVLPAATVRAPLAPEKLIEPEPQTSDEGVP
jgi:hypothetical protein